MKIVVYSHEFPPFLGGLATTSYKLVKGFCESEFKVAALVPSYNKHQKEIDDTVDCNIYRVPFLGNKIIRSVPFLQQLIGLAALGYLIFREKPDVVLFITEEAESIGGILSVFIDFKSVVRVAGSGVTTCFFGNNFIKNLLKYPMMKLYRKSEKIIAVSNYAKSLLTNIGVPKDKIEVVFNGINEEFLNQKKDINKINELKKRLGIDDNDKVLITIARIVPRKGQDNVIKSLPKIMKAFPNIKYLVVGEGRYKEKFQELASKLNLDNVVKFTGGIDNKKIINYLDMSDIFIMPNRVWNNKVEGLPNALIEAAARGLAVIAGNESGSVEAVVDGKTGFLIDPNNIDEISDAIIRLLTNSTLLDDFGKNGIEFIIKNFREDLMINNYVRVLKEAASS
ncbi:MAG: glycosyltransferase family 4 protein [Thermodesulfobacteriota bacterium]